MKKYTLQRTNIGHHKFVVTDDDSGKKIKFGHRDYDDYTIHKDDDRKKRYLNRHSSRENAKDIRTAGFWATNILWNKKSIRASMADIQKKFRVKIILKRGLAT